VARFVKTIYEFFMGSHETMPPARVCMNGKVKEFKRKPARVIGHKFTEWRNS
jgi:hypothetical protein